MVEIFDNLCDCGDVCRRDFADRFALGRWGVRVVRSSSGQPFLGGIERDDMPCISISHTKGFWAIMSSEVACGLDVELTSRRAEHLVAKFAMRSEVEVCEGVYCKNPSLLVWCIKEAVYKFLGDIGVEFLRDLRVISAVGDRVCVEIGGGRRVELEWYIEGRFSEELLVVKTLGEL